MAYDCKATRPSSFTFCIYENVENLGTATNAPADIEPSNEALFTAPIEVGVEELPKPMQYKILPGAEPGIFREVVRFTVIVTFVLPA